MAVENCTEPTFRHLINGKLTEAKDSFDVINPSTLKVVGKCPIASETQVEDAIKAAKQALPAWSALSLDERKKYMTTAIGKLSDSIKCLGHLLVQEQGKPLSVAGEKGEVSWAIMNMQKLVQEAKLDPVEVNATTKVYRRPVGVVAGITPWNFPVFCSVQKWAPALLLGNTFVHKPSPFTPLTGLKIAEILQDVFPAGVFNVVTGDDKGPFNVGAHLSKHKDINMVSFTGSVPTGKKVMANAHINGMRRVCIEAGGNDAAIVREDVDPATVAPMLFAGAFANSGQICCAIKRCYVHEAVYEKVVEELVNCAKKAKFGDGFEAGIQYGPLNNKMQFDKVMDFIEDTKKQPGAKIMCGGNKIGNRNGYFIEPTIVTGVKEGVKLVDEEQFGPVLPIIKYSDDNNAIQRANNSDYGLGGSVWSTDTKKAAEIASKLQAGTVWINAHTPLTGGPFGGFKNSGIGRELGMADVETFTELQSMYINPN